MFSKDIAWLCKCASCSSCEALWLEVESTLSKVSNLPTHAAVCGIMLLCFLQDPWRENFAYCIYKGKQTNKQTI